MNWVGKDNSMKEQNSINKFTLGISEFAVNKYELRYPIDYFNEHWKQNRY